MDPRLSVLLVLLCAALCSAEVPQDCCLIVANQPIRAIVIKSYKVQEAGRGCAISATVVQTRTGRRLCIPHPEGRPWVRRLIKIVDQRQESQQK